MKLNPSACLVFTALMTAVQAHADGPKITSTRCTDWNDSLEQGEQVRLRMTYALRCAKTPEESYDITEIFKGIAHPGGTVTTNGYPIYGIFLPSGPGDANAYKNPSNWFAPKSADRVGEGCDSVNTGDGLKPQGYKIIAYCASGCYTPEQMIMTDPVHQTQMSALEVFNRKLSEAAAVDASSNLNAIKLKSVPLNQWITDFRPTHQKIITLKTLSGGSIRVTTHHPLLSSAGTIRTADQFKLGDALVKMDGTLDPVVEATVEDYFGQVYNFDVDSEEESEHLLVAQGFINGSVHFQNEDLVVANRKLLRTNIIEDLMQKYGKNE